ncbi:MAG: ATP-binding cassette domain-containing protein [Luminiphilus sp.]|nr:ATP-binding cassette domain-containing protein [Luminiphilus sp.]
MMTLLTLDGVSMRYEGQRGATRGEHSVLAGVDLALNAGERLGLIGRNGSGKSTLLRIMAKIFAPTAGVVRWAPEVSVSLLTLGLGFRTDLTGRENALLSCLLQGLARSDAKKAVPAIAEFCELGDFFDRPVYTYSAGMRARLGFGSALVNRSQVILIDETLGVGDVVFREKARAALLSELHGDRAVVLVSHAEAQIQSLCTSAVLLGEGGVLSAGEPSAVLSDYAAHYS